MTGLSINSNFRQAVERVVEDGHEKDKKEVALAIGYKPNAFYNILRGDAMPSVEKVALLCDKYNINPDVILYGIEGTPFYRSEKEIGLLIAENAQLKERIENFKSVENALKTIGKAFNKTQYV